jgi:hypothetical protein
VLCARPDLEPGRFLSGSLSNLMLFDQALDPGQVAALHREYLGDAVTSPMGVTTGGGPWAASAQGWLLTGACCGC